MRYLGGKSRLAKHIAPIIANHCGTNMRYYEPFLGSAAVAEALVGLGANSYNMYLSDISYDLILLYRGIQNGWVPPERVTEKEYREYMTAPPSTMRGFVGYGCSWGGKFFGGYARGEDRNYAAESKRALLKTMSALELAMFVHLNYQHLSPIDGSVVYCDPPYENTTKYSTDFDHNKFWHTVRKWSRKCHVFVSEYSAPDDFVAVWEQSHHTSVRGSLGSEKRTEKLFVYGQ